jgi:uncharacterized protein (TIGR03083 family)
MNAPDGFDAINSFGVTGSFDAITELRFALAEADAEATDDPLRQSVVANAVRRRRPGAPVEQAAWISGLEVFRRTVADLDQLLTDLADDEWGAPSIRGLTVQELVGHLIGVEEAFASTIGGADALSAEDRAGEDQAGEDRAGEDRAAEDRAVHDHADDDHVGATEAVARDQRHAHPAETHRRWSSAVTRTAEVVAPRTPVAPDSPDAAGDVVRFHRLAFPLDQFMVVRAFEMWTHTEDIERATGRPRSDPDPRVLDRMTTLATTLLPAGITRAGTSPGVGVRLVLSGPGGGTWDVPRGAGGVRSAGEPFSDLSGHLPSDLSGALVVLGAAQFCRVVANRLDRAGTGAVSRGDDASVDAIFAGAAALALD